jgi:hypothetical protein
MGAAANFAWANRQVLAHEVRRWRSFEPVPIGRGWTWYDGAQPARIENRDAAPPPPVRALQGGDEGGGPS